MSANDGGAFSGEPAAYGGCGSYSANNWRRLSVWFAAEFAHQGQAQIDAGGNSGPGDAVAIDDDPFVDRGRAEYRQRIPHDPVSCGTIAVKQPCGTQDNRARANARDPVGTAPRSRTKCIRAESSAALSVPLTRRARRAPSSRAGSRQTSRWVPHALRYRPRPGPGSGRPNGPWHQPAA